MGGYESCVVWIYECIDFGWLVGSQLLMILSVMGDGDGYWMDEKKGSITYLFDQRPLVASFTWPSCFLLLYFVLHRFFVHSSGS